MKVIIFGSTDFTLSILTESQICKNVDVVEVVTKPDTKKDRKGNIVKSHITLFCEENSIPLYQPKSINTEESKERLKNAKADIFIVVAYGEIMKKDILKIPTLGAFNIHASLLPRFRGAAPIEHAIMAGDKITGVTLQKMSPKMDAGDVVLQNKINIDFHDNYESLYLKVIESGKKLIHEFYETPLEYADNARKQNEDNASYCYKIKKHDGLIDWSSTSIQIYNKIRALDSWPVCYSYHDGIPLKVYSSEITQNNESSGLEKKESGCIITIDNKRGIIVQCGSGALTLKEMQLPGKKRRNAKDFINGLHWKEGDILNAGNENDPA